MKLFLTLFIIILIFLIFKRIGSASNRLGKEGEHSARRVLKKLRKYGEILLNDIMITYPKGSTQIDHILITSFGIIVIETKNYSGVIYGYGNSTYWKEFFRNGKEYKFYSPLKQNEGHINVLKNLIYRKNKKYSNVPFFSVIFYVGNVELKLKGVHNAYVVKINELGRLIDNLRRNKSKVLSQRDIIEISKILKEHNTKNPIKRKMHTYRMYRKHLH